MGRLHRLLALAAVLGGLLLIRGRVTAQPTCQPATATDEVRLTVSNRPDHALIADASVELAAPAPLYLEYGNDQLGWLRTPTAAAAETQQLPLVRLRPETSYVVRAFALDGAGCPATLATAELRTGPLPALLNGYRARSTGQTSAPLELMDWRVNAAGEPAGGPDASKWLVALDRDNQVVWYYAVQRRQRPQAVERLPNGNFVYLTRYQGFEEITPDARSVRWMPAKRPNDSGPHHDFTVLPDGRILYLGAEDRTIDDRAVSGKSKLLVRGDTLDVLDPASGTVERVWGTFDAFDPADRPQHWAQIAEDDPDVFDWTHANTVMIGPRGNLIVSIRHLDQIISLAPDFKTIEWKLGGFGSSFSFADPSDRFYGQHDVSELPGGRILMFDNGNYRPEGEYSRGLELQLDFETMTAHKVWEYRQQPDVFSSQLGSAVRLSNGETILNFGFRDEDPKAPVILAEARPDGSAAWEQSLTLAGLRASRYRTLPLDSLAGELPVEPTAIR